MQKTINITYIYFPVLRFMSRRDELSCLASEQIYYVKVFNTARYYFSNNYYLTLVVCISTDVQ